jgi:hypothetical protein
MTVRYLYAYLFMPINTLLLIIYLKMIYYMYLAQ